MLRLFLLLAILGTSTMNADPNLLARQAAAGDASAIRALRAMGQPGVDALLNVRTNTPKFHAAIDAVCKQRDCAWSGLYWHTDLETAKRVAQKSGRPILSLRLLGNLDEELSCANSRYFRTLLYPNREISKYLRANYVLHWQSERKAPLITIDFGDGRRMHRTITGNSIHYVLDAQGRPLDGIPGLYAPPEFLALLKEGAGLHRQIVKAEQNAFEKMMERLEKTLLADTFYNEKGLHQYIHFEMSKGDITLEALNAVVYEKLFASPAGDPWMGLVADTSFTGITGEGLTLAAAPAVRPPQRRR